MRFSIRLLLLFIALALLALQVGFVLRASWATRFWPWPDTPLTYLFVGAILAAVALPLAWAALYDELAALRAGALDFAVTYAGIAMYFLIFQRAGDGGAPHPYALLAAAGVVLNLLIYLAARRTPFRSRQPMPALVRGSFLAFALTLLAVGGGLIAGLPHLFPWPLEPDSAVLIGCIFIGAAVYFLHGFRYPLWHNACGQLLGFMAYDLVLLPPFLYHFASVRPEHRLSLTVYVIVLGYSLVLAAYFLLVHRPTRLAGAGGSEAAV